MPGKSTKLAIPSFTLDPRYLLIHKEGLVNSNFGQDHTFDLIEGGFGLYSSARVREKIGPLKSEFYRIGFCRRGSLQVDCGLETFTHEKDTIHFNFPGQLFALKNKSEDMFSYYILFTQAFIDDLLPVLKMQSLFPFFDYSGVPFFKLGREEAAAIEQLIHSIDKEVKSSHPDQSMAIPLLIYLLLIEARRSYIRQKLGSVPQHAAHALVIRYKKLVAQHFSSPGKAIAR